MIEYGPDKADHEHLLWLAKHATAYAQCMNEMGTMSEKLPFVSVSITLTRKEYDQLMKDAIFDRDLQEHLRLKLGLPYAPYGYKKYMRELYE